MGLFDIFFKKEKVEEKSQPVAEKVEKQEEKKEEKTVQQSVPLSTNQTVISPSSFEELQSIILMMRDKGMPALINLSNLDVKTAQRYVDVLSGAVVALNGNVVKIQQNIYYFCPNKQ